MFGKQFIVPLLLLAWVVCPAPADAESPEELANAKYRQAKSLVVEGDLEAAERLYSEAWDIYQHPLIMKKRAEVRERLLDFGGALVDYRQYFALLSKGKRKERRVVLDRIALLESLMVKPVRTTVVASETGVLVSVDRSAAQPTPFDVDLIPGAHTIRVVDERYESARIIYEVLAGAPGVARIEVRELLVAVRIGVNDGLFDGVSLRLDGVRLGLSQQELGQNVVVRDVLPGAHQMTCSRSDGTVVTTTFEAVRNTPVRVLCDFSRVDRLMLTDPWGWVTVGLGVGAVGAGIGYLVSWSQDKSLAESRNQDLRTSKHIAGGVLLGVGTALAVGSYFVFTRHKTQAQLSQSVSLVPSVMSENGDGWGLSAVGRF